VSSSTILFTIVEKYIVEARVFRLSSGRTPSKN